MTWAQVRNPNLTVQGSAGWCLQFTQNVWGTVHIYPKAIDAWNDCKQYTGNPPANVSTVVYWTYREAGIQYGHIATFVPGRGVYSSPFDTKYGAQWFSSISAVTKKIQTLDPTAKYLGWSDTLSHAQLIKQEEPMETSAPVFNKDYYLKVNPDVAKAGIDPVQHWLKYGITEGRASAPNFHVMEYVNMYPDLKKAYGTNYLAALQHYYNAGIAEGRFGTKAGLDADNLQNTKITDLTAKNKALADQLATLGQQVDPNNIVITPKGWTALWDTLKGFLGKNN